MQNCEDMLAFFHSRCADALAVLDKAERTKFLGSLDKFFSRAVLGLHIPRAGQVSAELRQADLLGLADKWYGRLQTKVREAGADGKMPPKV